MSELRPFKFWCQKVLPLVYDDSLSYYELLCKVVDYLNNTITDVNKLSKEFQTLYNYVHDYFNNLDVQEEINNKLDNMAESGYLTEVINNLLLKLRYANVCDFGADPDGLKDSTNAFKEAITYAQNNNYGLYIPSGVYVITEKIVVSGYKDDYNLFKISCNNSVIKSAVDNDYTLQFKGGKFNVSGGLTINGKTSSTSGILFDDPDASIDYDAIFGSLFSDITVTECNISYTFGEIFDTSFYNLISRDSKIGINWTKANFSNANSLNFYDCDIQGKDVLMNIDPTFTVSVGINFFGGHFEKYGGFNKTIMEFPPNMSFYGTRFAVNIAKGEDINNFITPYVLERYNVIFYDCNITSQHVSDDFPPSNKYFRTSPTSHHIVFNNCTISPCYGNAGNLNKNRLVNLPDTVKFNDVLILQDTLIITDASEINFHDNVLGDRYVQYLQPRYFGFSMINKNCVDKSTSIAFETNENYTKLDNKELTKFTYKLKPKEEYFYEAKDLVRGLFYVCFDESRALFCCDSRFNIKQIYCDSDIGIGTRDKTYSVILGGKNIILINEKNENTVTVALRMI